VKEDAKQAGSNTCIKPTNGFSCAACVSVRGGRHWALSPQLSPPHTVSRLHLACCTPPPRPCSAVRLHLHWAVRVHPKRRCCPPPPPPPPPPPLRRAPAKSTIPAKRNAETCTMGGPCVLESGADAPACTDNFQVMPFTFNGQEWQSCEQCYQVCPRSCRVLRPERHLPRCRRARARTQLAPRPFAASCRRCGAAAAAASAAAAAASTAAAACVSGSLMKQKTTDETRRVEAIRNTERCPLRRRHLLHAREV
jgi:hypothetical protein